MYLQVDKIQPIEAEELHNFEFKASLTEVECYGLQLVLTKLQIDYNEDLGYLDRGDDFQHIDFVTRHLDDCLDILDGVGDILYIADYKITSVYLTTNNIPILKCIKSDSQGYNSEEDIYYATIG